jgi:hypothetical protein
MLHHQGRQVKTLRSGGRQLSLVLHRGRQIYPFKRYQLPQMEYRTTDDGAEKWFEVGFRSPEILTGNATTGWTDPRGLCSINLQRSEDLIAWADDEMLNCPVTAIAVGDGSYDYWSRCKFPIDSLVKTGQLSCESTAGNGDARNNPFISLTINSVVRSLGGFPYTMPADASRLQADMRSNGLTGATVVATSDTVWRVEIPNVDFTSYSTQNKIGWADYISGVDPVFGGDIHSNGRDVVGAFVNASGVRTAVPKQFVRLAITPLPQP